MYYLYYRVKAPRRRPPSQALRDDTLQQIGLSNGHEGIYYMKVNLIFSIEERVSKFLF